MKTTFSVAELKTALRCMKQFDYRWLQGLKIAPTFTQASSQGVRAGVRRAYEMVGKAEPEEIEEEAATAAEVKVAEVFASGDIRDPHGMSEDQLLCEKSRTERRTDKATRLFVEHTLPYLPSDLTPDQGWALNVPGLAEFSGEFSAIDIGYTPIATRIFYPIPDDDAELLRDPLLALDAYAAETIRQEETKEAGEIKANNCIILATVSSKTTNSAHITFSDDSIERALDRIESVVEAVNKGCFMPAPHDSWTCNNEYCGFYGMCPYGQRNRTQR